MKKFLTFLCLLPVLAFAQGEQKQVFGKHEVHYILLNSSELAPEVARAYNIPRSSKLAFLSLSILEYQEGEPLPKPVPAIVTAEVRNLLGQARSIELEEIRETGGLYYIGTFRFDDEDLYRFRFEVKTDANQRDPYVVEHQQKLYIEE
jgi:hypothetical protein